MLLSVIVRDNRAGPKVTITFSRCKSYQKRLPTMIKTFDCASLTKRATLKMSIAGSILIGSKTTKMMGRKDQGALLTERALLSSIEVFGSYAYVVHLEVRILVPSATHFKMPLRAALDTPKISNFFIG